MATNYQFIQTRNMFKDYLTGYPKNPDYATWSKADPDDKAALLFVTFYQEITLAWFNAISSRNIVYISQEDGVSTILQYLMKNVEKIDEDAKRYTPQYIYQVAFNCLLGLCNTRGTEQKRCASEVSNEYREGDKELDFFDLVPSNDEDLETAKIKEAVWEIIRKMGPKAEKVANHLINPGDTLHKVSRSSSERPTDRLADVAVSKSEYEAIVAELKVQLEPYKNILFGF